MKHSAYYLIKKTDVTTRLVHIAGSKAESYTISTGLVPNIVILAFIKPEATIGTKNTNPFNFENHNIKSIELKVGSKQLPYTFVRV